MWVPWCGHSKLQSSGEESNALNYWVISPNPTVSYDADIIQITKAVVKKPQNRNRDLYTHIISALVETVNVWCPRNRSTVFLDFHWIFICCISALDWKKLYFRSLASGLLKLCTIENKTSFYSAYLSQLVDWKISIISDKNIKLFILTFTKLFRTLRIYEWTPRRDLNKF